jgi:hypothetical protein
MHSHGVHQFKWTEAVSLMDTCTPMDTYSLIGYKWLDGYRQSIANTHAVPWTHVVS